MTFHKIIAEDILNSSISWKFAQLFNILQKMYEIVGSCCEGRDYLFGRKSVGLIKRSLYVDTAEISKTGQCSMN